MVNSIVSGLSAEWIDSNFTSIQVSWDQDSTASYRIWYSPVVDYEGRTWMLPSSTAVTTGSSIVLTELEPTLFYSISVESVTEITTTSTSTGNVCMWHKLGTKLHADTHFCQFCKSRFLLSYSIICT